MDLPFLDDSVIDNLKELGNGDDAFADRLLVVQLISVYLDNLPERISHLSQGMSGKNAQEVERAAHTLKSSSRLIGLMSLGQKCQELENMGFSKDISQADPLFESIMQEIEQAKETLPKKIEELEK